MKDLQKEGKLRFIGVSGMWNADTRHEILRRALQDDCWDAMMAGFNILNQCARDYVFPEAKRKNTGMTNMFPVRLALSRPEREALLMWLRI